MARPLKVDRAKAAAFVLALTLLTGSGCALIQAAIPVGDAQVGTASWYGGKFIGRRTASGEGFNANAMTAAHRWYPFGTQVRVTNLSNGRSVVVRVNDRGPFIPTRIIDVSAAAANALGFKGRGTARVRVQRLGGGGSSWSGPSWHWPDWHLPRWRWPSWARW